MAKSGLKLGKAPIKSGMGKQVGKKGGMIQTPANKTLCK